MTRTTIACFICIVSASPTLASACLLSLTKHEQRSGSYKVCWYNCPGGEVAVTIKSTRPCPLKIER